MNHSEEELTRRKFVSSAAALAAAMAAAPALGAQERPVQRSDDHHLPNEQQPLKRNMPIEGESPSSIWPPETDNGTVQPFWYSFELAHKRITDGGWTRQVTSRELAVSKRMAGVEMRLVKGGVRELHWHVSSEWAYMITGTARITAVDAEGRSHVSDVNAGDLWLFPGGVPHSIQGVGDDGATFLLVFDQGDFDEFSTFLLTDFMAHTPKEVLAKNFGVPESTFDNLPKKDLFIFPTELPRPLNEEVRAASAGSGIVPQSMSFFASKMPPTKVTSGGEVRIIDNRNFPITNIAAAIVKLKPGGLRELHWHPLSDEWQYYVSGKGRMTIFEAGSKARTFDFQQGDVGYIGVSRPHYIENTGTEDLVFLEVFPISTYQDISLAEWLAHTPARLVDSHIHVGEAMLNAIAKKETVVDPR